MTVYDEAYFAERGDPFADIVDAEIVEDDTDAPEAAGHAAARRVPNRPDEAAPPEPAPAQVDLLAGLRDGGWLNGQDFPELRFKVPGIIPEGLTLLVGPPKVGKSWLALAVSLAQASGGRALGLDLDERPVLHLALEDGHRRMDDRCGKLLGKKKAVPVTFQYMLRTEPGRIIETIGAWLERYGNDEPLVVLDTLGKATPPTLAGETAYARDYRIASALKAQVDDHPGSGLVAVHHDRKAGSADFVESVSGTNGLAGAADTIVVLSRPRHENEGLLQVTGRDVEEAEYALTLKDGTTWELVGGNREEASAQARARSLRAVSGVGDQMADVIACVAQHREGVSPAEVAKATRMDAKTAGTYLGRAVDTGRLQRLRRGVYAPVGSVESVESPAREAPAKPTAIQQVLEPDDPNERGSPHTPHSQHPGANGRAPLRMVSTATGRFP